MNPFTEALKDPRGSAQLYDLSRRHPSQSTPTSAQSSGIQPPGDRPHHMGSHLAGLPTHPGLCPPYSPPQGSAQWSNMSSHGIHPPPSFGHHGIPPPPGFAYRGFPPPGPSASRYGPPGPATYCPPPLGFTGYYPGQAPSDSFVPAHGHSDRFAGPSCVSVASSGNGGDDGNTARPNPFDLSSFQKPHDGYSTNGTR